MNIQFQDHASTENLYRPFLVGVFITTRTDWPRAQSILSFVGSALKRSGDRRKPVGTHRWFNGTGNKSSGTGDRNGEQVARRKSPDVDSPGQTLGAGLRRQRIEASLIGGR